MFTASTGSKANPLAIAFRTLSGARGTRRHQLEHYRLALLDVCDRAAAETVRVRQTASALPRDAGEFPGAVAEALGLDRAALCLEDAQAAIVAEVEALELIQGIAADAAREVDLVALTLDAVPGEEGEAPAGSPSGEDIDEEDTPLAPADVDGEKETSAIEALLAPPSEEEHEPRGADPVPALAKCRKCAALFTPTGCEEACSLCARAAQEAPAPAPEPKPRAQKKPAEEDTPKAKARRRRAKKAR